MSGVKPTQNNNRSRKPTGTASTPSKNNTATPQKDASVSVASSMAEPKTTPVPPPPVPAPVAAQEPAPSAMAPVVVVDSNATQHKDSSVEPGVSANNPVNITANIEMKPAASRTASSDVEDRLVMFQDILINALEQNRMDSLEYNRRLQDDMIRLNRDTMREIHELKAQVDQAQQSRTFLSESPILRGSPSLGDPSAAGIPVFHRPRAPPAPVNRATRVAASNLDEDFSDDVLPETRARRDSVLRRLSVTAATLPQSIQYTRSAPSYLHIKLERLTLVHVVKFIEEVLSYVHAYRLNLPFTTLVTTEVREQLISHNVGLTITQFHALSVDDFFALLLREVRPEDKLIFYSTMAKSVKMELPSSYKPSPLDFKPLYQAILRLREKFMRVYEILAEDNQDNIPDCTDKDNGLIRLWIDAIPFGYGKKVYQSMPVKKFHDIYAFVRAFMVVVEKDFERYRQNAVMKHHFSGTAVHETTSAASSRPSRSQATQRFHEIVEQATRSSPEPEVPVEYSDSDLDVPPVPDADEDLADVDEILLQQLAAMNSTQKFGSASKLPSKSKPATQGPTNGLKSRDGAQPPTGCFRMLFYGTCDNAKCKFSHDPLQLTKLHEHYLQLLRNSKYRPKTSLDHRHHSAAVVQEVDRDGDLGEEGDDGVHSSLAAIELVQEFTNLRAQQFRDSAEDIAKAVHRQGYITLPDDVHLKVEDSLFDTGAVHASYMSEDFVDRHRAALEPYRLDVSKKVCLADKVTIIPVNEAYELTISFCDDNGNTYTAEILFWVLPQCNHEFIIGLPAILRHFHDLHKQMLDTAVEKLAPQHLQGVTPLSDASSTLRYPWTYVQDEVAPEDLDTPLPCSFTDALHYMEMPYDEAVQEFLSLLETHVHKNFADATPIIKLLQSKGIKVFVPSNWDGIKGVPDIDLQFKEGMPTKLKPPPRRINPKLTGHAKKEFDRLMKYFYRLSNSDIASCLVIAPKATPPYIRFCGDYVIVNGYMVVGHYPIPHVQHTLERIIKYSIFLDFDLANSFHQFRLSKRTSAYLSVQTPWGQVEPIFMPEGIGPASGILQKAMYEIFADFEDWAIVIFDNLLVMATDYEDAYRKVDLVLDRCLKHNIYLKFSKTWLGFPEANFFGYVCRKGCYELSQVRKEAVYSLPFPHNTKQMQSFLGSAVFFKSFVKNFSALAAPLYDMVRKEFNWDESTWGNLDYRKAFQDFKDALLAATAIYYPNYEYEWILRTDASRFGIGAVLLQACPSVEGADPELQPITFFSQKFSDQATRWATIEQEAYAIFAAVRHLAYYLSCKPFILETDHNNLLYMEQSIVPKIIRWRVYLQSFTFMLRHIPGKLNAVADYLSRLHEREMPITPAVLANAEETSAPPSPPTPEALLLQVHGGRMGHNGARRTWLLLNKYFPGHRIPYRLVEDFVSSCAICQKCRLGLTDAIQPVVRHLKPPGRRSAIGADTLTVTPPDKDGYRYVIVIVNHFTKFCFLVPTKSKDALTAAHALFSYFATFGLVDCIYTDPGSEFDNNVVEILHKWLGVRHRFSLVERHESNGVEGTNKILLRYLMSVVHDERIIDRWASLMPFIQYMLNSRDNSEIGMTAFKCQFGSADEAYYALPVPDSLVESTDRAVSMDREDFAATDGASLAQAHLAALDKNLAVVYKVTSEHQAKIAAERTKATPPEKQNVYQPGDLVLWQLSPDDPLPTKLTPPFLGPFEVLEQVKNDVECRHVLHGYIKKFHVTRLKIFHGDIEKAKEVAQLDQNQSQVKAIHAHCGDPKTRTTMDFQVEFEDGDILWLAWSKDLFDSLPYETYCRNHPELTPLLYTVEVARELEMQMARTPITAVEPGDTCFVDLRYFDHLWYDLKVPFEDKQQMLYLVFGRYLMWENQEETKISIKFEVFNITYTVSNVFIQHYGYRRVFPESGATLVDKALVARFPDCVPPAAKKGKKSSSTSSKKKKKNF